MPCGGSFGLCIGGICLKTTTTTKNEQQEQPTEQTETRLAHERRTRMFLPLSPLGFFAFAVGRVAGAGAGAAGACGPSIWMHRRQSSIGVTILACSSAFASFIFEKPRSQHTVCREVVFAATVPVTTTSASAFAGAGFGFGGADSGTEGEGKGLELDGEVGLCGARGGSGGGTAVMGLANPSFVLSGAVSPAREGALANFTGAFSNNTFRTTEDI